MVKTFSLIAIFLGILCCNRFPETLSPVQFTKWVDNLEPIENEDSLFKIRVRYYPSEYYLVLNNLQNTKELSKSIKENTTRIGYFLIEIQPKSNSVTSEQQISSITSIDGQGPLILNKEIIDKSGLATRQLIGFNSTQLGRNKNLTTILLQQPNNRVYTFQLNKLIPEKIPSIKI